MKRVVSRLKVRRRHKKCSNEWTRKSKASSPGRVMNRTRVCWRKHTAAGLCQELFLLSAKFTKLTTKSESSLKLQNTKGHSAMFRRHTYKERVSCQPHSSRLGSKLLQSSWLRLRSRSILIIRIKESIELLSCQTQKRITLLTKACPCPESQTSFHS